MGQAGRDIRSPGGHHLGASLQRARSTKQSVARSAAAAPVAAEGTLALASSPPVDFVALKERARRLATALAAPAEETALVERLAPAVIRGEAEYRTASRTVAEAAALVSAKLAMGLGTVTHLMEASESQLRAVEAVAGARSEVRVSAYTFDAPELVAALIAARRRGVQVRVLADRKFSVSGKCRMQQASWTTLQAEGIAVKVMSGLPGAAFGGIHHAKTVCADGDPWALVVGSCSFTKASLGNMETGVRIHLTEHGAMQAREMFDLRFAKADDWKTVVVAAAQRAER